MSGDVAVVIRRPMSMSEARVMSAQSCVCQLRRGSSVQIGCRVRSLSFSVAYFSFFLGVVCPVVWKQTNPTQTETLYKLVEDLCNADAESVIYDLYCGTGMRCMLAASLLAIKSMRVSRATLQYLSCAWHTCMIQRNSRQLCAVRN